MAVTQQENASTAPTPRELLLAELDKVRKFLDYLQQASARGDRADDDQLASLGMARTPRRTWYQEGSCQVLEFPVPAGVAPHPTPLLMTYSFINRWYILDLMPGHSFIEALGRRGWQVYLIDWGIPGPEHASLSLDYYLEQVARRAVERLRRRHRVDRVFLFGYCLGGTLAAMMAARHPEWYKGLILLTTPLEFQNAGLLSLWTNKEFFRPEKLADAFGVVPEKLLHASFPFLKPKDHLAKPRTLYDNITNDAFLQNFRSLDRWATDNVPFPGQVFKQVIKGLYQEDQLANGEFVLGGQKLRLGDITCPTLNIYAKNDHIAPPSTCRRNADLLTGCRTTNREYDAAHLTVTVAHPIRETVWRETADWLAAVETGRP
ncbi:MAG: Polyhydroxyalkanoic acid synthase [Candidatus Ozemobacter sibiricus]|jgi:polyhydroxyalkanoate synthase|uniref:Polyhydroxyalkanoic acid synthase n=1 Tax=Candidatus Ozemobacter sibiricus TaxID=2268124 RepID=A0A367ZKL7_9BACT|nr:MAG: Polyhydroxyalkanoic acid synthase [Candidatus Ozemobacter sibiricus]